MKRNRREVVVINDGDSTNNQPAGKNVRREEEPGLAEEILGIHHKVVKLEKDKLGAIRIAGEAQARVEFLENLIDKKRESVRDSGDGGEKQQMDELQKKIDELSNNRDELTHKLKRADEREIKLAEEQQKKLAETSKQLEEVRRQAASREEQLQKRIDELAQADDVQKKQAEEQQKQIDDVTKHRDELLSKLTQHEGAQQLQLQPLAAVKQEPVKVPPKRAVTSDSNELNDLRPVPKAYNKNNIFELRSANTPDTILFQRAKRELHGKEMEMEHRFTGTRKEWMKKRRDVFSGEKLYCSACMEASRGVKILAHFFSRQHDNEAVAQAVSRAAFDYWMRKLESIRKPTVTPDDSSDSDSDFIAASVSRRHVILNSESE